MTLKKPKVSGCGISNIQIKGNLMSWDSGSIYLPSITQIWLGPGPARPFPAPLFLVLLCVGLSGPNAPAVFIACALLAAGWALRFRLLRPGRGREMVGIQLSCGERVTFTAHSPDSKISFYNALREALEHPGGYEIEFDQEGQVVRGGETGGRGEALGLGLEGAVRRGQAGERSPAGGLDRAGGTGETGRRDLARGLDRAGGTGETGRRDLAGGLDRAGGTGETGRRDRAGGTGEAGRRDLAGGLDRAGSTGETGRRDLAGERSPALHLGKAARQNGTAGEAGLIDSGQENSLVEASERRTRNQPLARDLQKLYLSYSKKTDGKGEILSLIKDAEDLLEWDDREGLKEACKNFVLLGLVSDCNELGLNALLQEIKSSLF